MLQIRPNCECCDADLSPDSEAARICSYECTFCADCVEQVLHNVCPNCGGGFVPRPIRPATARREGVSRQHQPPSTERVHSRFNRDDMQRFAEGIKDIPPAQR